MFRALIKGTNSFITVDECVAKYSSKPEKYGIQPICDACDSKLFVHGAPSISVATRFQHGSGKSCNIEKDKHHFGTGVMNVENGKRIKDSLKDEQYLKQLYSFCHKLYGRKNFTPETFYDLLKIAKQKNIWYYHNLEPENFGFILLTLQDFIGYSEKNGSIRSYIFRFYLTDNIDQLQLNNVHHKNTNITKQLAATKNLFNSDFFLVKVFANGNLMNLSDGNPYKVCRNSWDKFSKEYIQAATTVIEELKAKISSLVGR